MQMSKRKHPGFFLLVLLTLVLVPPLLALAQNEPRQPVPATSQPPQKPQEAEADRPGGPQDAQQGSEQAAPGTGLTAKPLKEFTPTDKIGADSAVSFPVDI